MLNDIRNTDTAEYWKTLRQRWGALLSYRYIGRQFSAMNNVSDDTVTLRHDMRSARMESHRFRTSSAVRASVSADGLVLLDVHDGLLLASNPVGL